MNGRGATATRPGLVLFDDRRARSWEPFALTRPAGELLFGSMKLVERAERALGLECIGYLTSEHLAGYSEPDGRQVLQLDRLPADRDLLFWCSRAVAEPAGGFTIPAGAKLFTMAGQPVGLHLPAGERPVDEFIDELHAGDRQADVADVNGRVLDWIWDVMLETPEQIGRDLAGSRDGQVDLPPGVYRQGDGPLSFGRNVRIEPQVLFDTRGGPIRLADDVEVRMGTRLAGPAVIGPRSRLLGGSLEAVAAGPYSYLRGEVAETVVLGYTNKAHDGHLGHAYVGRWVNLGAFTTNSDLKNNYGTVRVWTPNGPVDTGRIKVGCFLGDHVKTGIGLLLGSGTVLGAGTNVFGTEMPPTHVRPFSWGRGGSLTEYRLEAFLETAATAMGRRGVELGERGRGYLESCWRMARGGEGGGG